MIAHAFESSVVTACCYECTFQLTRSVSCAASTFPRPRSSLLRMLKLVGYYQEIAHNSVYMHTFGRVIVPSS